MVRKRMLVGACIGLWACFGNDKLSLAEEVALHISAKPVHDGRISPMLFGNFVELLDDLVPGMWAEMLNDRDFEGVTKPANWVYCDGAPNVCDRTWDANPSWSVQTEGAHCGSRCAKIAPDETQMASLTQSGLAVKQGMTYQLTVHLRGNESKPRVQAVLKTMQPNGEWFALATADIGEPSTEWAEKHAQLVSSGTTDRAVFALQVAGKGNVWVDKVSLQPADNVLGWRADVVEAIRDAHPAVIRWGGSVCDPGGYLWKKGIGQRDKRVAFPNRVWGRIDSNDVGIDEFCQFCELVRAQPLVCLSFADGPQSAADLVEYCNGAADTAWGAQRAANGRPVPYHVKYWQLGNEISGDDESYLKISPSFCAAMKRVDPDVVLFASFPSQKLLDHVGPQIAYIGPHHYTPDFTGCDADFNKLAEMIRKTPGCGHLRIAVTEWNVSAGDWGLLRGKFLTLETALLNARYLNLLCRHSDIVDIACRSNMTNSLGSGIIATNPAGLLKRPSYHVMKLYADHAKPVLLGVSKTTDNVDILACASEKKDAVCIFAVNMSREPIALSCDLKELGEGFGPNSGELLCDTQDARQPDVMNHWAAPDRVKVIKLTIADHQVILPALSASAIECGKR